MGIVVKLETKWRRLHRDDITPDSYHTAVPGIIRLLWKLLARIVEIRCARVFIRYLTVSRDA